MAKLALEIVTLERKVWEDTDLDMVILPGIEGELGVLPRHVPLLTALKPGVITIRKAGVEELFAVGGGFVEVRPDKVTVLATAAEHSEEIDAARAEEARKQAAETLQHPPEQGMSIALMQQALMRAETRIKVINRRRNRPGGSSRDYNN
jgi:F-type H+-transporting ATPase subunit epsilon